MTDEQRAKLPTKRANSAEIEEYKIFCVLRSRILKRHRRMMARFISGST